MILTACSQVDGIHVSVGPVTLHVGRDTLRHLHDAVGEALARLDGRPHERVVHALAPRVEEC